MLDDNRGLFKPALTRGRPTSINLLDPESPFLDGLAKMPVNGATRLHSIIGTGGANPLREPGDGVVAVSSARHYGDSEIFVPAKHEKLHRHPDSINEVCANSSGPCQRGSLTRSSGKWGVRASVALFIDDGRTWAEGFSLKSPARLSHFCTLQRPRSLHSLS